MGVHLLDGTYKLFRHFYAGPKQSDTQGHEAGAIMVGLGTALLVRLVSETATRPLTAAPTASPRLLASGDACPLTAAEERDAMLTGFG